MTRIFSKMLWVVLGLAIPAMSSCGHGLSQRSSLPLAPESIEGRQVEYADLHGINIYSFFTEGRYRYATLSKNRTFADSREGHYEFERTGKKSGTIRFHNEPSIHLVFTSSNSATGRIDGDCRSYRFLLGSCASEVQTGY